MASHLKHVVVTVKTFIETCTDVKLTSLNGKTGGNADHWSGKNILDV